MIRAPEVTAKLIRRPDFGDGAIDGIRLRHPISLVRAHALHEVAVQLLRDVIANVFRDPRTIQDRRNVCAQPRLGFGGHRS
jgi:hypothetical protein